MLVCNKLDFLRKRYNSQKNGLRQEIFIFSEKKSNVFFFFYLFMQMCQYELCKLLFLHCNGCYINLNGCFLLSVSVTEHLWRRWVTFENSVSARIPTCKTRFRIPSLYTRCLNHWQFGQSRTFTVCDSFLGVVLVIPIACSHAGI